MRAGLRGGLGQVGLSEVRARDDSLHRSWSWGSNGMCSGWREEEGGTSNKLVAALRIRSSSFFSKWS